MPLLHHTEERIAVTGRQGRRRKQLLYDLKEKRRYCNFKEDALDRTQWRSRFEEATALSQDRFPNE
jgi:hypothetical protein